MLVSVLQKACEEVRMTNHSDMGEVVSGGFSDLWCRWIATTAIFFCALLAAGIAMADCTLCRHKQYGIEGYFDGFEAGIRSGNPYYRTCPEGWAAQRKVDQKFCAAAKPETMTYGSANDVFQKCPSNRAGHEVWIGGRLNDLVLIGHTRDKLQYFPVRDGGLTCGQDVRHAPTFTVIRHGRLDDLMYVYTPNPDGTTWKLNPFRIQDGVEHDIAVGIQGIARIYGKNGDVIMLYHVDENFNISQQQLRLGQYEHYQVRTLGGDDFGINLRGADAILMRICRRGGNWWRSSIVDAPSLATEHYPAGCDIRIGAVNTPPNRQSDTPSRPRPFIDYAPPGYRIH